MYCKRLFSVHIRVFLGDFIWNSGLYSYYVTSVKIRKEDPHMHKKKCEPQEYAAEFIIAVADYLVYLLKSGKKKKAANSSWGKKKPGLHWIAVPDNVYKLLSENIKNIIRFIWHTACNLTIEQIHRRYPNISYETRN